MHHQAHISSSAPPAAHEGRAHGLTPAAPFLVRLLLAVLAANLCVAALTFHWVGESRRSHEERARVTLQNLAQVLDENIASTINEVNLALLSTIDEAERQLASGGIDPVQLNVVIARARSRQPDTDGMRVSDAEGNLLYGDGIKPTTHATILDRAYFIRLREDPSAELVISEPVVGRISGKPVLILARRINRHDGSFAGVALASLALDYLTKAMESLDVGPHGAIELRDLALHLISRYPRTGADEARIAADPHLAEALRSDAIAGAYRAVTVADDIERQNAYRKVSSFPFYIVVGLSPEDYLATWRSEVTKSALLQGLFLVISMAFAAFIYRAWQRQRQAVEAVLVGEAQLRAERNFNQQLIRTAQAIVLVLDPAGNIVFFNRFMEELTGYALDEVRGRSWFDTFLPPQDREKIRALFSRAIGSAHTKGYINPIVARDGRTIFVEWYDDTLSGDDREIGGVLAIGLDVTERLRGEERLRDRQEQLNEAQRLAHIGSWSWLTQPDAEVHWSDELYRIFGLDPERHRPQPRWPLNWLDPADEDRVANANRHALASGEPYELELGFFRPDGSSRWITARGQAKCGANGAVIGLLGTIQDITERRQATAKLQHLNRLYSVLSRTNEMIVRVRTREELFAEACRIPVEVGGFAMAWIGLVDEGSGEITPAVWWGREEGYLERARVVVEEQQERGRGPVGAAIRDGVTVVCSDIASDERMQPWRVDALSRGYRSLAAFPIRDSGRTIGAYTIYAAEPHCFSQDMIQLVEDLCSDISFAVDHLNNLEFRMEAERQLRVLNQSLEERVAERTHQLAAANRELESFSYSASHDLRAPLRSIEGFSKILRTRYAERLDDTGRNYLDRVCAASKRMSDLIDDLLMLSQLTRIELRRGVVDLSAIAHAVADALRESAPSRAVEWVIEERVQVYADARLMRTLLENLLGNAWKFTARTPHPRIEFGAAMHGHERAIFVRDNGAGFDMQYADKLFAAFQRLHGADEFEGTGIGLATVQRIVVRHGGRIWARGAVGEGATFYFVV